MTEHPPAVPGPLSDLTAPTPAVTGNGACLNSTWQALPESHIGVGIDVLDDALLAWCAPKVGRISTFQFANTAELDAVQMDCLALTAWFIDQGFDAEQAATATCELLSRLGSSGWQRGMFGQLLA